MRLSNDGYVDNLTCYRLCPKSVPNRCFGKNVAIVSWMGSYATIAMIAKTMLLPKEKAWSMQNSLTYIWPNHHLPGMAGTPHVCQWWAANHVGLESSFQWSSLIQTFFNFRLCCSLFIRVAPKAWIRMWNIYVTSIVINSWCWSHPVTLVHGLSHPYPGQHWMPPRPPSPRWLFDWVALLAIPSPYSISA